MSRITQEGLIEILSLVSLSYFFPFLMYKDIKYIFSFIHYFAFFL